MGRVRLRGMIHWRRGAPELIVPVVSSRDVDTMVASRRPDDHIVEVGQCCSTMRHHLAQTCDSHSCQCPDEIVKIYHSQRSGEDVVLGIPVHDGGTSFVAIRYCPWCGARNG